MIYELRIYHAVPGRLPALLVRFQNRTLPIWERHGIRQAGFWTTLVGESNQRLTYMLAWDSSSPTPNGSRPAPRPRKTANSFKTSATSCWRRLRFPQ